MHEPSVSEFLSAACAGPGTTHSEGTLDRANEILAGNAEISDASIYSAATLGDAAAVRRWIEREPALASAKGGPFEWDALTYLCFSKYVRLDPECSTGLVDAATVLLDAGADANTGWFDDSHQPEPEWESALYGAAGVAHHAPLARLLLERGADPNDNETPYHAPETYDNAALAVLVESGKLSADSLETMLLRKADWHDRDGMRYLLEHGADANRMTRWPGTALHHALRRDNALDMIALLMDHGANPLLRTRDGVSGVSIAARRGRGDVLRLFSERGVSVELDGVDRLLAACATDDSARVDALAEREPALVEELRTHGGARLAEFAGVGNVAGVRRLLDLGADVDALYDGDMYYQIAPRSSALHVAAWRAHKDVVRLLIERGADVNAADGMGRTPLLLAVRACVDSYWAERRTPDSVSALLAAGAMPQDAEYPCGYAEVDALIGQALGQR